MVLRTCSSYQILTGVIYIVTFDGDFSHVIDFAERENAAGGPSDPDIPARLLHHNCGTCLRRKKK